MSKIFGAVATFVAAAFFAVPASAVTFVGDGDMVNISDGDVFFGNVVGEFAQYEGLREAANETYQVLLDLLADDARRMNRPVHEIGAVIWTAYHGLAGLLISSAANPLAGELLPRDQALSWLRDSPRAALVLMLRGVLSG